MLDAIISEVQTYCYMVQTGKPCAMIPAQNRHISVLENCVKAVFGLSSYTEKLNEEWSTLWIYKDEYMLEIIKSLPDEPKTTFDHWILGKAFGYSDEAIKNFLKTKL